MFSFPDLARLHDFATHEKEIDDLDFSPDSNKLCSISKVACINSVLPPIAVLCRTSAPLYGT